MKVKQRSFTSPRIDLINIEDGENSTLIPVFVVIVLSTEVYRI